MWNMQKTQVRFSITPDLLAWVQEEAERRMVSPSYLVARGLELLRTSLPEIEPQP